VRVIRAVHVPHDEVRARLEAAAAFMSRFSTVLSLSYDVLVYWAILLANEDAPNRFKSWALWALALRPISGDKSICSYFGKDRNHG
jgi:hypothetical protein